MTVPSHLPLLPRHLLRDIDRKMKEFVPRLLHQFLGLKEEEI
jgi:hypothetical protein